MVRKNNKGFSLIEVIVAVAILTLLMAPIIQQVIQTLNTSAQAKERQYAVENAEYILNYIQETPVSKLNISVYNQDGKNYVEYSIGTQKYTAEILSSEVAVYVKSSARVDSSDANGVDVTVTNTTTLPVYFKVVDDDATNPRYKLVGRSGVVKEYK